MFVIIAKVDMDIIRESNGPIIEINFPYQCCTFPNTFWIKIPLSIKF